MCFSNNRSVTASAWLLNTAVVLNMVVLPACGNAIPESPPPPGSWLVLLCKASDDPSEPQPKAFYQTLFARGQSDLLFDYFDQISGNRVDISGTRVQGWFSMPVTAADLSPTVRNNAMPVTRAQTAIDCRNAAISALAGSGMIVDPANYAGVITVINIPVDAGDAGNRSVVISTGHASQEIGFIAHEMLHVMGLQHSWRAARDTSPDHVWQGGTPTEYYDCWDMMSFRTCVYLFQSPRGAHGPELQGAYAEKLGWLKNANRIQTVATYPPTPTTITLAPVSDPTKQGVLLRSAEQRLLPG